MDAALGQFLTILAAVAVKCGVWMVKVNPKGTSQECANCGATVPKTLADREHRCACGLNTTRDRNSARVILKRALHAVGLTVSACGGLGVAQPAKQEIPIAMLEPFTIPLG
ncbi:transposase [Thermosynechococcus sp. FA-CM-4201]